MTALERASGAPPPWERQPTDTPKSWQGFVAFRDLGPDRTLAKAGEVLGKGSAVMADWSQAHNWVIRANAWDAEQDRLKLAAMQREVIEMARRHARHAQKAQDAAMVPIDALMARLDGADPKTLTDAIDIGDLIELAQAGMRALTAGQGAERLARGEPTEIVQQQGIQGMVVAGPVGIERLELVLNALQQAGVKIGVTAQDDDPGPVIEATEAAVGPTDDPTG